MIPETKKLNYLICVQISTKGSEPLLSERCDEGMLDLDKFVLSQSTYRWPLHLPAVKRGNIGAYDLAFTSPKCGQNYSYSFVKVCFNVDHDKFECCYTSNDLSTLHNLE